MQTIEEIRMQNDDTTIANFGEQADDLMTEMAAAGMHGMSTAQADLVVRMGVLLDFAARKLSLISMAPGPQARALINQATNHALAMRMHGATLRGVPGAEMLENLCDAALGRLIEQSAKKAEAEAETEEQTDRMTVEEAMTMLKLSRFNQLAYLLGVSDSIIKRWRSNGFIHPRQVKKIRALYRGMGVAA